MEWIAYSVVALMVLFFGIPVTVTGLYLHNPILVMMGVTVVTAAVVSVSVAFFTKK